MAGNPPLPSVVVGIDGSQTAIHAAQWAIDEAIGRGVPLRLMYSTKTTHPSANDYYEDIHRAERALRQAQAAVEATGKPVKAETAILHGPAGAMLVSASRDADMVCVGTTGVGRLARAILGSTAFELAEKALCPVAIIRPADAQPGGDINWIVVAVDDSPDNETVVGYAMEEAKLRGAPVLALGTRPEHRPGEQWKQRYPDVHVYPVTDRAGIVGFLTHHDEPVQLAVIAGSDADQAARIVRSSVLIVRP